LNGCVFFDHAQPPPVAQSVPKPNTFEVFFDPDRSDISETAAQIIREAAVAAIQSNVTSIKLTVHSTAAGWDADSQALSLRRAEAIKAVLVKDGVLEASITSVDVQRAQIGAPDDGVREPQNRRTEIILY
jgi:outer membrane protein OmpA-like peptidoglycan-associated protein